MALPTLTAAYGGLALALDDLPLLRDIGRAAGTLALDRAGGLAGGIPPLLALGGAGAIGLLPGTWLWLTHATGWQAAGLSGGGAAALSIRPGWSACWRAAPAPAGATPTPTWMPFGDPP